MPRGTPRRAAWSGSWGRSASGARAPSGGWRWSGPRRSLASGGTALGGGTVVGLAGALLGTSEFSEVCRLAGDGDRAKVDLVVSDIYRPGEIALPDELTAASFGKLGHSAMTPESKHPENLAAAILGLVGENVGLICAGLSYATQVQHVVYGGSTLHENPYLRDVLHTITSNTGRTPVFLPQGEYGGATGALVLSLENS